MVSGVAVTPVVAGAVTAEADLLLFLVVGVLAGAHCLGMCGPLVTTYADRMGDTGATRRRRLTLFEVRQHGLFNAGRTVGYAVVGGLLGLVGGLVFDATALVTPAATAIRAGVGVLVGTFIVAAGVGYLLRGTTATTTLRGAPWVGRLFGRVTGVLTSRLDSLADSPRIVGLGAVHALLPCPILYPAYLYALAAGDPVRGALALGVLGLGTVPTLLAYGLAFGSLSTGRRVLLHRAMGVSFLLLGYLPLAHGLMLLGVDLPRVNVPFYQPL
jgi:hypothetical protein